MNPVEVDNTVVAHAVAAAVGVGECSSWRHKRNGFRPVCDVAFMPTVTLLATGWGQNGELR